MGSIAAGISLTSHEPQNLLLALRSLIYPSDRRKLPPAFVNQIGPKTLPSEGFRKVPSGKFSSYTQKITDVEWKLIFQPRSMLIYCRSPSKYEVFRTCFLLEDRCSNLPPPRCSCRSMKFVGGYPQGFVNPVST